MSGFKQTFRHRPSAIVASLCVLALIGLAVVLATHAIGDSSNLAQTKSADARVPHRTETLMSGTLPEGRWHITAGNWVPDPHILCLEFDASWQSGPSGCGFDANPMDGDTIDTATLYRKRFIFGPAPISTTHVLIRSWCSNRVSEQTWNTQRSRIVAVVSLRRLPKTTVRPGKWFLYERIPGSCAIEPEYVNSAGTHIPLGSF